METFQVHGKLFGKDSRYPSADKTRAILPLPAILSVIDAVIACKMHEIISRICVPPRGVMFGARKGTQVLDVAHAVQLHLQRGGDNFGAGGFAQGDISAYYDSISCLKICKWIVRNGAPEDVFWASAFIRLQLLPTVFLTAGDACTIVVASRSLGALTGSRSAVAAGRIPVETVACEMALQWSDLGVKISPHCQITFASWVDNYYAFGSDLSTAISIAESFEDELQ